MLILYFVAKSLIHCLSSSRDVYKRQRQKYARVESGTNSITLDILSKVAEILDVTVGDITRVPVSYTHLDVYKRQTFQCLSL